MLGNVSEWTSSWFEPYPDWVDPVASRPGALENPFSSLYPSYVKVIRGSSCADREPVVLRLPFRNFVGIGREARPIPQNHFDYVGFRCAAYLTPGLDRLEPSITRQLLRPKRIRSDWIARDLLGACAANRYVQSGTVPEHQVYVTGRSSTVLAAPFTGFQTDDDGKAIAKTAKNLIAASEAPNGLPFGIFHTDLAVTSFAERDPAVPEPDANLPGLRKGSQAKRTSLPATLSGKTLSPGTYVFALVHGRVAVQRADLTLVGFLDERPRIEVVWAERTATATSAPRTRVTVDPEHDRVEIATWVAAGGKGTQGEGFLLTFGFATASGALDKAGSWRCSGTQGR